MSDGAAPARASWRDRFLLWADDRLNPILVREVNQALNGRGFMITAGLALLATVLIALLVAAEGTDAAGRGARVFAQALVPLSIIVLFIVPLQAFVSTRQEVTSGTVEHLLMSRLKPATIVRGKLAAATVQFVLYLAIFSPLMAMTFLLRGVDVPTIAFLIATAFVFGLAASSIAVAAGALSRWPNAFRVLPFAILVVGLGGLTMTAVGAAWEIVREVSRGFADPDFWPMVWSTLAPTVAAMILCALVGASALAHPYENRSTPFRLFALITMIVGAVWMAFLIKHFTGRFGGGPDTEILWGYSGTAAACLVLFFLFAATEEPRLSPRVRERVPRNRLLALLVAPLLPGAGRGMLFTILMAGLGVLLPLLLMQIFGFPPRDDEITGIAVGLWLYVLIFTGLCCLVRLALGPGSARNWIARATLPLMLLLGTLLPLLAEVIVYGKSKDGWRFYEILNPFHTLAHHTRYMETPFDVLPALAVLALVVIIATMPAMVRGLHEVMVASRARRQRES